MYGVIIRNSKGQNNFENMILLFTDYDKAKKSEKLVRFLDTEINRDSYYSKVQKIKMSADKIILESEKNDNIICINNYPILVEYFDK